MTTTETLPVSYSLELDATATIAAAYFAHHMVDKSSIAEVIGAIRKAVRFEADPVEEPAPALSPAIPIKRSVTPDLIFCLEDGKGFKSLKRHLSSHYGMTPEQYRAKWGLPEDYPMVAPNYSAKRSQLAKDNGLGKKGSH